MLFLFSSIEIERAIVGKFSSRVGLIVSFFLVFNLKRCSIRIFFSGDRSFSASAARIAGAIFENTSGGNMIEMKTALSKQEKRASSSKKVVFRKRAYRPARSASK